MAEHQWISYKDISGEGCEGGILLNKNYTAQIVLDIKDPSINELNTTTITIKGEGTSNTIAQGIEVTKK